MRDRRRFGHLFLALFSTWALLAGVSPSCAQSRPLPRLTDPAVVPDDDLTLVVGTHFIAPTTDGVSAKAQFTDARIPLSAFNETDRCLDQTALEVATEYFTTLGRVLGKAGHYYFLPEDEISKAVSMCEKLHGRPPQAWVSGKTKIIAFGKVVPTVDASALEKSVR